MEKENIVVVPATILEAKGIQTFVSKDSGEKLEYSSVLVRFAGVVLKLKVSVQDKQLVEDLKDSVDQKVNLSCELYAGPALSAGVRVVGVER